jgi:hypothetical protein
MSPDDRRSGMKLKIRLIWRKAITDFNGVVAEYVYKTDDIVLPENAQAFQFVDTEKFGWMPELVGGEWIREEVKHNELDATLRQSDFANAT